MKLEKLTPQQEEKMFEVRDFWKNYIFSCQNNIDKVKAKEGINFIYKLAKLKDPSVLFVASPLGCQYAANLLKANVGANVGANVRANVRDNELKYESFAAYGSISDYGWVSFYDFFTQVGVLNHDGFNKFKDLLLSGIYDMIQLEGVCIVCELPKVIKRNAQGRLHSASGSAIKWSDGYEIFYWNGVSVPEKWIMKPNEITRDEILKEDNAEKRRCLRKIIGAKEYYDIITDGEGMNLIDEDIDNQGFPMKLYQTKSNDSIIGKKVMVLEVTCPSTNRVYNLYPPNQSSKNVWEAKASTFNNESLQFRHGDVGLKNIETNFVTPIMET